MKASSYIWVQAVFALLGSRFTNASSPSASIYITSSNKQTIDTPETISETETRLILASRLGLSRYHSIGSDVDLNKLERANAGQNTLWMNGHEKKGHAAIVIGGMSDTTVTNLKPDFILEDTPSASSFGELLKTFGTQAEEDTDTIKKSIYRNNLGGFIDIVSPSKRSGIFLESDLPDKWEYFEKVVGTTDASLFKSDVKSDVDFFEEFMVLQEVAKLTIDKVMDEKATILVNLVSLEALHSKYGVSSAQYKCASKLFVKTLTTLAEKVSTSPSSIIILPPSTRHAKKDFFGTFVPNVKKRDALSKASGLESPFMLASSSTSSVATSPASPTSPLFVGPYHSCYTTELGCKNGTNNCNDRGSCFQSRTTAKCWSCQCNATVVQVDLKGGKKGNLTTYWGGSACHKRDISTPFFLIGGFTLLITFVIVGMIGMMFKMGSEELPGTLSAGVSYKRT